MSAPPDRWHVESDWTPETPAERWWVVSSSWHTPDYVFDAEGEFEARMLCAALNAEEPWWRRWLNRWRIV